MEPFNIWESFDNSENENEYDPMDDDNSFDQDFLDLMKFKKSLDNSDQINDNEVNDVNDVTEESVNEE